METAYAYYETEIGLLLIGYRENGIVQLCTAEQPVSPHTPSVLADRTAAEIREYLAGKRRTFTVPVVVSGTAFQQLCRRAVMQIPYGETRTYGQIAAAVGRPQAARAVGAAMASNPVWILIPCHRVVGANGVLTGYAGGIALKQHLLCLESGERVE